VSGAHTLIAIVADEFLVFSALFASFSHAESTQKWGWFAIGIISFFVVVWHVALHGSRAVKAKAKSVGRLFTPLLAFTFILWAVYFV
jgi:bacteriorhodopsin